MRVLKACGRPRALSRLCTGSKKICPENDCNPHVSTVRPIIRAPHALSYECHLQEAKEQDTSKKIAATRRLTSHNTLPDHDVLLRARLAQSHGRPGQQVGRIHVLRRGVGPLDQ